MSYELYKFSHLSLIVIFFILASTSFCTQDYSKKKISISLFLVAVLIFGTGLGLMGKLKLGFPNWIIAKIILLLLLILAIPFIKKNIYDAKKVGMILLLCMAIGFTFLAVFRPF